MNENLTLQDVQDGHRQLKRLNQEVHTLEGTLAGGKKLGPGALAVESLLQSEIWFGDPVNNLTHLTRERFEKMGIPLTETQKIQLDSTDWSFYYMTLSISIKPGANVQFTRLITDLTFSSVGMVEPIVQSLFPTSKWSEVLRVGGNMRVGVNANLEVGVDLSQLPDEVKDLLPGQLKAQADAKAGLHLDVVTPHYSFQLGHAEIIATGQESPHCYWRFEKFNVQQTQTLQLCLTLKVPSSVKEIRLRGIAGLLPSIPWLLEKLRHVYTRLSGSLQTLLGQQVKQPKQAHFLVGIPEEWILKLPD